MTASTFAPGCRRFPVTLVAVVTVGNGRPVMPCGRCRQLLYEHGGADLLVDGDGSIQRMDAILPGAFGPDDIF